MELNFAGLLDLQLWLRWTHLFAGVLWVGLLYFFNLVNVPFMKEMDATTKGRVVPSLLPKALFWFRWAAVVTVLAGFFYWMIYIVAPYGRSARAIGENPNTMRAMGTFFLVWFLAWGILYVFLRPAPKSGTPYAVIAVIVNLAACWIYLWLNAGITSNQVLAIGLGGGMGLLMMLNVWGVIWRAQKRIIGWTKENAATGAAIPAESAKLARQAFLASRTNFWLSFPMLLLMAISGHHPGVFGR